MLGIEPKDGKLTLYRRGGVSEGQLRRALAEAPEFASLIIHAPSRRASDGDGPQEAPGQLLTHYAPDVVTYLARGGDLESPHCALRVPGGGDVDLGTAVAVDLGGQLARMGLHERCLAYRDLSATQVALPKPSSSPASLTAVAPPPLLPPPALRSGSVREASRGLFDALRWSEGVPGAKVCLLAMSARGAGFATSTTNPPLGQAVLLASVDEEGDEDAPALADRMFRAASGRVARAEARE